MNYLHTFKGFFLGLLCCCCHALIAQTSALQVGDKAPDFIGYDQNGKKIHLADFKGKKIVLYFYPKDDSPGCTKQACNLRDDIQKLTQKNCVVLGISADDKKSHQAFAEKYQLPFPLIADTDKTIATRYHAYRSVSQDPTQLRVIRITYVINEAGIIHHIFNNPQVSQHTQEILDIL